MDKNNVNLWININADKFNPSDMMFIKDRLESMSDDKFFFLQTAEFRKPSTILIIAIFLGWDRFFLDDVGLGVAKIITCYGCGIWWLIDIFSATNRTQKYNINKFIQMTNFLQ
ncbi:MAG: TM2 domain-containing protein [Bacteroidales bacterium]|jgi:hypothetical protein|nr:TM2 domain-containing protein [Bacteroidales bacterium]